MKEGLYRSLRQSERYQQLLEDAISALSILIDEFESGDEDRETIIAQAHGALTVDLNTEKGFYKLLISRLDD